MGTGNEEGIHFLYPEENRSPSRFIQRVYGYSSLPSAFMPPTATRFCFGHNHLLERLRRLGWSNTISGANWCHSHGKAQDQEPTPHVENLDIERVNVYP